MILRPYQQAAIDWVLPQILHDLEVYNPGRYLIASPTGTGKSFMELGLRAALQAHDLTVGIVSPRTEILRGIAEKMAPIVAKSQAAFLRELEARDLWTPVRLLNRLTSGEALTYDVLIYDEGHHALAETYETLLACHGLQPAVGFTASPFRGAAGETELLRRAWGEPYVALDWPEAVAGGYVAAPLVEIEPLVNCEQVTMKAGDFQIGGAKGLNAFMKPHLRDLAKLVQDVWRDDPRPMMVTLPSSETIAEFQALLEIPCNVVTDKTKAAQRQIAFTEAASRNAALLQIAVVGEGIDIPELDILIDARPTLSCVAWLQMVGRITRPHAPAPPRYICTNRNLERHAYLLDGLCPRRILRQAQEGFGGPLQKSAARRLGLEVVKRHKAIPIPLADGTTATAWVLQSFDDYGHKTEWVILCVPDTQAPLCATRVNVSGPQGVTWGTWVLNELPKEFLGYQTSKATWQLTDPQADWWRREAASVGLNAQATITARQFQILPVLKNTEMRIPC